MRSCPDITRSGRGMRGVRGMRGNVVMTRGGMPAYNN